MFTDFLLDPDNVFADRPRTGAAQRLDAPMLDVGGRLPGRGRTYATPEFRVAPNSGSAAIPDITSIRVADTEEQRRMARELLQRMYRRRGYNAAIADDDDSTQQALVASDYARGNPIATFTMRVDGGQGLFADRLYGAELDALRAQGRQLCETIRLAADPAIRKSRRLMGALFHVAFLQAYRANCCTDLVIEVTPRHAAFYRRMMHFDLIGDMKWNPRVKTAGVLLRLDLDRVAEQIRRCASDVGNSLARSLYPRMMPASQEAVVFQRIMSREPLLLLVA